MKKKNENTYSKSHYFSCQTRVGLSKNPVFFVKKPWAHQVAAHGSLVADYDAIALNRRAGRHAARRAAVGVSRGPARRQFRARQHRAA